MDGHDPIEEQLRSASEGTRDMRPDAGDRFDAVRVRARQRAVRGRAAGVVVVMAVVLAGVALATQIDRDDSTPLATTGSKTTLVPEKSTTSSFAKTTTSFAAETTSTTGATSATSPEKSTSTTSDVSKTTLPPPPKTTTTTVKTGSRPPVAYMGTKEGGKVKADEGSSCWTDPETHVGLCSDVAAGWADDAPILTVSTTPTVYVWWDTTELPKSHKGYVAVRKDGQTDSSMQEVACEGTNPCAVSLQLAPGEYVLTVQSFWAEGDVAHAVRLQVQ